MSVARATLPVLRPSQRLRAVALAGGPVTVGQAFVEAILREVRMLEGDFGPVTDRIADEVAAKAKSEAMPMLDDAEAVLGKAQAALRAALRHEIIALCGLAVSLAILWWGV